MRPNYKYTSNQIFKNRNGNPMTDVINWNGR